MTENATTLRAAVASTTIAPWHAVTDCLAGRGGTGGAMDDRRAQRLADNESAFRDMNERIGDRVERWQQLDRAYHRIVCECADADCVERIAVTPAEHRMARGRHDRFLIARGHDEPAIERVLYRTERFWLVQKHPELV